jgi:hypothetical protein
MKTDPRTGRPYAKEPFSAEAVDTLLCLADAPVPMEVILGWNSEQIQMAGDWALRVHLRASDNLNRVPPKPAHVAEAEIPREAYDGKTGTVMDIVAGLR